MDREDRILVTGGTGFIGGRLVEVLANRGFQVRVTTSDFQHGERVAHLPVELVKANLNDHDALARALIDCKIVFHAAYQFEGDPQEQRRVNLDGTKALAEAFLKNGGRRFVHFSSITAYGERDGEITEESPQQPSSDYGDVKQSIERMLRELHHARALPVTIVQPTIVYGPYGYAFTIRPLEELRRTRVALPAGGLCNAVYVDDVVVAAVLAAEHDAAVGETFIISGTHPVSWRQFYGAYEKILGRDAVVELDDEHLELEERRQRRSHLAQRLLRYVAMSPGFPPSSEGTTTRRWGTAISNVLSEKSEGDRFLFVHHGFWRALYAAKSHARIDKARRKLGYEPAYDLDKGMQLTAEWAQGANLLSV